MELFREMNPSVGRPPPFTDGVGNFALPSLLIQSSIRFQIDDLRSLPSLAP